MRGRGFRFVSVAAALCAGLTGAASVRAQDIRAPAVPVTVAAGKLVVFNNSLTLSGTDATTMTFPTTSATIARTDAAQTFSGTQTFTGIIATSNAITIGNGANPSGAAISQAIVGFSTGSAGGYGTSAGNSNVCCDVVMSRVAAKIYGFGSVIGTYDGGILKTFDSWLVHTASGAAPGATKVTVEATCGTSAGTAKLIAYAGTSTTPVTLLDNIGSGVSGC